MNYNKKLLDDVYEMYSKVKYGYNENCMNCKNNAIEKDKELTQGPVPIFHVGKDFDKQNKRLLFIGLVAYGWNDIITDQNATWEKIASGDKEEINKIQKLVENRFEDLYFNKQQYIEDEKPVKFISFLKEACNRIYEDESIAYNNIAITNFVRCNMDDVADNLPQIVRDFCCSNNSFFVKEIEILKPTHIIVLTQDWKYARYVDSLELNIEQIDHPSKPGRVKEEFINEVVTFYNS